MKPSPVMSAVMALVASTASRTWFQRLHTERHDMAVRYRTAGGALAHHGIQLIGQRRQPRPRPAP